MQTNKTSSNIVSAVFGLTFALIGILNVALVHPVPGIVFLVLSLIYLPGLNLFLQEKFGFSIPLTVKVVLGLVGIWFTLGISDLAEILGL